MIVLGYWILYSKETSLKRFAWGSCGGTITGPQNFLKDSLTILKAASNLGEAVPWFFPLLIVFALLTSLSGLLLLTACMKRYDATYSAAAFVGSFVVSASINAACHYNTFTRLPSTWNDILYPLGLIVLMFGVYILETSSHHREKHETENQEVSNNHDGIRERKDSDDSQVS
jgi:SNF family Na+-dependent transporter